VRGRCIDAGGGVHAAASAVDRSEMNGGSILVQDGRLAVITELSTQKRGRMAAESFLERHKVGAWMSVCTDRP
jgi:hypothetical protein